MNDRDCANCGNRSDRGCKVWECEFKPIFGESKQPIIEELEKIKTEIQNITALADSRGEDSKLAYQCQIVINEKISELKGEN